MDQDIASLLQRNPRIDARVVEEFARLASQVPATVLSSKGAEYGLTHPFDTAILDVRSAAREPKKG